MWHLLGVLRASSYAALPARLYQRARPAPVRAPRLLLWNAPLAAELGLPEADTEDTQRLAAVLGGNELWPGTEPLAQAYAGHQFGRFVPQLGDGRAHLIGELVDPVGRAWDVQLKGSGPTAFSRGGDGRCALGPALREFIMSEAMHALGISTTRCLAVVATGELVHRERTLPGAVVTRVAASHLRVGTFEYLAAREDRGGLVALLDYAIRRHYPELEGTEPERALGLLAAVIDRQLSLVVEWMRVGFIHGVMNTDNTSISGETIDYGPCAMMNRYDPGTVFSSIDHGGRYAFGNQPLIAGWNLARLAETLLPIINEDEEAAVAAVMPHLEGFGPALRVRWRAMMGRKLGLDGAGEGDQVMIDELLKQMQARALDYTQTFHRLRLSLDSPAEADRLRAELGAWYDAWRARLPDLEAARVLMRRSNPVIIPRNHQVEAALAAAERGELGPTRRLLDALRRPYEARPGTEPHQAPPETEDAGYRTFCGT